MESSVKAPEKDLYLQSGEVKATVEEARALRRHSRQLRADSERLKLRSIAVHKSADALAIRVLELTLDLDRIGTSEPLTLAFRAT